MDLGNTGAKRQKDSPTALSSPRLGQLCGAASVARNSDARGQSHSPRQSELNNLVGRLKVQEELNAQLSEQLASARQIQAEQHALFHAETISYCDIAHLLPTPLETMTVCAKVIYRHMWSVSAIHWKSFQSTLEDFVLRSHAMPPLFIACLFAVTSMSRYLPVTQGIQPDCLPREYPYYADLAAQIIDRRLSSATTSAENLFLRLQIESILVMYYCVHSERSDMASAYFRLGNALRCASALRLFNERSWLGPMT